MKGLRDGVELFREAKVSKIYVDGSFTSDKPDPNDIDGCWSVAGVDADQLDKRFWDFETVEEFEVSRQSLKSEFGIDFFMAEVLEGKSGKPFPEFFQTNRNGEPKGIVQINLEEN